MCVGGGGGLASCRDALLRLLCKLGIKLRGRRENLSPDKALDSTPSTGKLKMQTKLLKQMKTCFLAVKCRCTQHRMDVGHLVLKCDEPGTK